MTTSPAEQNAPDTTWSDLARLDPARRVAAIGERLDQLLKLSDDQLHQRLGQMVRAEYALDGASLYQFTTSRLQALLAIARRDAEQARRLARAYDRVFDGLPGGLAMRRAEVVQTVARVELGNDDVLLLRELVPALLRQVPVVPSTASAGRAAVEAAEGAAGRATRRKPWWRLW